MLSNLLALCIHRACPLDSGRAGPHSELLASLPHSPSGGTSLHAVTNGGSSAGPRREGQCTPLQSTPATYWPRSSMAHRPPTPPTRRRRQRAHGANSHAPRLQPPSSAPLKSGGLPSWATVLSPESEPGPRGRTQPRPTTPAPKPGLTSPSAFQQNTGTRKMTRERNVSCTQPNRQPNAGGATDAHAPTPPAACDRNALSAL